MTRRPVRPLPEAEAAHSSDHPEGAAAALLKQARQLPAVQEAGAALRHRWQGWQARARTLGDERLERLLEERAGTDTEVGEALAQRREEREQQQRRLQAREKLLSQAASPEERRLLLRVSERTVWTGGQGQPLRYTELLDALAPLDDPAAQMRVHRSLWSLAERQVLHVSGHGEVTACPLEDDQMKMT